MPQHEQRHASAAIAAILALGAANAVLAQTREPGAQIAQADRRASFDIPAGPLAPALRSLAATARVPLTFTADQTDGRTTAGLKGDYTPQDAFELSLIHI